MEEDHMKRLIIAIVLVLAVSCLIFGQAKKQTQATSAEQELIQAEKEWNDAILKRDVASMKRIIADDGMGMSPEGNITPKAEMITDLTTGASTLTSVIVDDITARVLGDIGVTWSLTTEKTQLKGNTTTSQYRHLTSWVKRSGSWQLFAGSSAKIVKK
jgi:ketosteroid isomerase-like protein